MTEPKWLAEARKELGQKEIAGGRHNPRILALFADAGFAGIKDDETAWCAAFVGASLKRAGIQPSGSLLARSYLDWGEPVTDPRPGDVVVFSRGKSAWQGHVAFFLGFVGDRIQVLEGNARNRVQVGTHPKSALLGYRRPAGDSARPEWPLGVGSRGRRVTTLQEALAGLGYAMVGKADGHFGKNTRDAVMALQADNGLAPDGRVDAELYARLETFPARQVSQARATTTEAELVERSRIAGTASKGAKEAIVAVTTGAGAAGLKAADAVLDDPGSAVDTAAGAIDKAGTAVRAAEQGFDLAERLTGGALSVEMVLAIAGAIVIGVLVWQVVRMRRIVSARLDDERTGKTR